jgi:hypothetical protein
MNKIFTLAIPVKNEESNIIELESKVNVIISQVELRGFEIEVLETPRATGPVLFETLQGGA